MAGESGNWRRRGRSIVSWWSQENPTLSGLGVGPPSPGRPRRFYRLVLRQRLALLLLLTVAVSVVVWYRSSRVNWSADAAVRVLLLELIPDGAHTTRDLMAFNGTPVREPFPLNAYCVQDFFADEYERYHPGDRPRVELHLIGPYEVKVDPPDLHDPDASTWQLTWRAMNFYRYFERVAADLGVDFDAYHVRAVAIFEPGYDHEQIEAMSLASPRRRFGVVRFNLNHLDPEYSGLTLLHELAHAFGASDKYDPDLYQAVWPQGFVEPDRHPVYPQQYAELMAGDLPLEPGGEREIESLDEVRIGVQTAYEMGWISWWESLRYYRGLPDQPPVP